MADARKKLLAPCVHRLAKLSSKSSLATIHADQDVLADITAALSSFGASPDFISPNADNTAYIVLFNKHVHIVQLQRKWELGGIGTSADGDDSGDSLQMAQHTVPVVAYREPVTNIASFVTSTIDEEFVFLVHKDERDASRPRSLADVDFRWVRFHSSEHAEEFIGHCLAVCAPQLLSKARMLVFQSGGAGTNVATMSVSEMAAETERLVAEAERTLVVTDLVVRSVSDILTKVKFEVDQAVKKSTSFTARWGMKFNDAPSLGVAGIGGGGAASSAAETPFGIKTCDHDFMHVATNNEAVCARMRAAGETKVLFSTEAFLTDHTHEMVVVTDASLRIEKARKDRVVHVIPFAGIEGVVVEANGPTTAAQAAALAAAAAAAGNSKDTDLKLLLKLDFSVCKAIRGDLTLRFPCTAQGLRHKNIFVKALTAAYEAVVVAHLPVTEAGDVFWARRGTLESQLVRLMKAIRPDGDGDGAEETPTASGGGGIVQQLHSTSTSNQQALLNARLALYLCVKQPQRVVYSLSASSAGVDRRLLSFLARAMHRIFLAHHEAVAARQREHRRHVRREEARVRAASLAPGARAASGAGDNDDDDDEHRQDGADKAQGNNEEESVFHRHGDLRCLGFVQPCVEYEVNAYRFHRARVDAMNEQQRQRAARGGGGASGGGASDFSRTTADAALLVPPPFGSSDSFASLALREYMGASGARFVSLCVGQPMESFSTDPQTLQPMGLQAKQFWASQFLRQLRAIVLEDCGVDEVMPDSLKVLLSLVWRSFERERQQNGSAAAAAADNDVGGGGGPAAALAALRARRASSAGADASTHAHGGPSSSPSQQSSANTPLDETGVIGGFLFSQFLRPSLDDPLGEGVLTSDLSAVQKRNLEDVTCLLQCVLTQSDLPLATRAHLSGSERAFLRRFVDNELPDASRVLRSLVYPDITADDPEGDDGSMVPDFFPPPVPGQIPFGSVSLLPHGDPRTVESFWERYLLKMPIDLHSIKLLNAFQLALRQCSLQVLTAAFVPSLHAVGFLGSGAVGVGGYAGVVDGSSGGVGGGSGGGAFSAFGGGFGHDGGGVGSPGGRGRTQSQFAPSMELNIAPASRAASPVALSAVQIQMRGTDSAGSNSAFSPASGPASPPGGARGGRMRSQTLVRAESQAYERFAAAEMTIHRLTYEVKQLKEQLAAAREAELETRMAAARAMENFSHSFALSMQRTQKEAAAAASAATNGKASPGKRRGISPSSSRRRRSGGAGRGRRDNSDSDSQDSDERDSDGEGSFFSDNGSFRKQQAQAQPAPANPLADSEAAVVKNILTPEARWRHALEHLPAASRSTRGAGSDQVFGCPMDGAVLSFLAMPRDGAAANPLAMLSAVGGGSGQNSRQSPVPREDLAFHNFNFTK